LKFNGEAYANKLHLIEKLIFPPQVFFSPGFVAEESKCSICGKNYEECEHVVGRAYMGRMCCRIITKGCIREISIVSSPGNKRARAIRFTNGDITRDYMTWRIITNNSRSESV